MLPAGIEPREAIGHERAEEAESTVAASEMTRLLMSPWRPR